MTHENLCEMSKVTKRFQLPSGSAMNVLEDVSLAVRANEILAVLGPSGCGKSTLMRVLSGLAVPEAGEVRYHDAPLVGLNPGVAMVFQSFALYPWLTVTQNIVEPLRARGQDAEASRAAATRVIHLVGLTGFDEAYPRELSGGMKQRVGIARALAVEPEILCMDEPFSQVDALTAENLRGEMVRFWSDKSKLPKTIFMVSHDVKEVVFMATRIVVMAARPGRVRTIIENELPYPRDYRAPQFQRLVDRIHAVITESEIPDQPPAKPSAPPRRAVWEPLPDAGASQIIGLMEVIEDRGGRENVFALAEDLGREFGQILAVVKAAELLDFVETPRQDVMLTEVGKRFLASSIPDRKVVFREQVRKLRIFVEVVEAIQRSERWEIDEDVVASSLALHLPYEDPGTMLRTLVNWGRHADLFDHDPERQKLFMERPEEARNETAA
jgi:NitT/TauT family transport system ATP-binding protein